jgi:hypothetical protein
MKLNRLIIWAALVSMIGAQTAALAGPFIPGQILTAAQLNSVVDSKCTNAACAITGGTITGVTIDGSAIGSTTPASGVFTTASTTSRDLLGYSAEFTAAIASSVSANAGVAIKTYNGTLLAPSATQNGNTIGNIDFWGYGSSVPAYSASIDAVAAGTFTNNSFPSQFNFNLTLGGSSSPVVAATLNASGVLATSSVLAGGTFSGSYTDGIVVDYATGNGRISVGANDTLTVYGGGVATTPVGYFTNQTGNNNNFVVNATTLSTAVSQQGINSTPTFNASATQTGAGILANGNTAAAAFTMSNLIGVMANANIKGAGSTVTSNFGFYAVDQTVGTNNYGYLSAVTPGANKWGFYNSGFANNSFGTGTTYIGSINNAANSSLLYSTTAPTVSSGFGASPSVSANNGTAAFRVNVGTGGTAVSGVVGLPTATTGWNCFAQDVTTFSTTVFVTRVTASTTTTVTIGNFNTSAAAAAWAASDVIELSCFAY